MKTETQEPDASVGFTWGESEGTYYLRNSDGSFRTVSENAMKLLNMLADGEMKLSDLDGGARDLVETLEDENYVESNRPVERIVTPPDIPLWHRSGAFFFLLTVLIYQSIAEFNEIGNHFGARPIGSLLDPSNILLLVILILAGLAVHESGHFLAARGDVDTTFKVGTVNGLFPAVI